MFRKRLAHAINVVERERGWDPRHRDLAKQLGKTHRTIENWLDGTTDEVPWEGVALISELSGYPLDYFAGRDATDRSRQRELLAEILARLEGIEGQIIELRGRVVDEAQVARVVRSALAGRGRRQDG